MAAAAKVKVLNFNIGVLGHVDSGKTSLAKVLSTTASTASFDKNPQSRERGITLDLGFSSFQVALPEHLSGEPYDKLQFTLVDCPGHASLIKTIIGGSQIIDMMMLVVDSTKGVQTQTAECLVIGEILCEKMVVALNKVDLLKQTAIEKMKKKLNATLSKTKFAGCPIIPVAANPGGTESSDAEPVGIQPLIDMLCSKAYLPSRDPSGTLTFAVDHCFSIRGQGTIMTGTILSGSIAINDTVEIPSMKVTKKVKSMQMFKQPIEKASQGDRVGICVTQFDPKLLERGLVCSPSSVPTIVAGIIKVTRISHFKGLITSKSKFHMTIGHETVMGKLQVFGLPSTENNKECNVFDFEQDYVYQNEVIDLTAIGTEEVDKHNNTVQQSSNTGLLPKSQWALIEFEKPVTCPENSLVIGSRLDTDIHLNKCRIAFHGKLLVPISDKAYTETILPKLKVYKIKSREGVVERMSDDYSVICRALFKKETNIQNFVGLRVKLSTGEAGMIEGGFGQSGKVKIRIPSGLAKETIQLLSSTTKKKSGKGKGEASPTQELTPNDHGGPVKVFLHFKRYIHDTEKKMIQT